MIDSSAQRRTRPRPRRLWVGSGAGLAAALGVSIAFAQPKVEAASPRDPPAAAVARNPAAAESSPVVDPAASLALAEARAAFQKGIVLAKEGRWGDALPAFERSDALRSHAITTYNIGYCERLLGHPVRAHKAFAKALADHRTRGSVELPADLITATQGYLADAERQIARVVVTIAPGALTVDGRPLEVVTTEGPQPVLLAGTRAVGPAEVPPAVLFEVQLDPGVHLFVLSVKGRPDVVANETLGPGAQASLELRGPPSAEATDVPTPAARPPGPESPPDDRPNRVPAYVALGIGAVALATGAVSGLIAFGYKGPVNTACESATTACDGKRNAGNLAADISTAGFIAGGVAVGVGAVLFFTASGGSASKATPAPIAHAPEVHATVGWGTLGLEGRF